MKKKKAFGIVFYEMQTKIISLKATRHKLSNTISHKNGPWQQIDIFSRSDELLSFRTTVQIDVSNMLSVKKKTLQIWEAVLDMR